MMDRRALAIAMLTGALLLFGTKATAAQQLDLNQAAQAVVRIRACDASGCDRGVGSGVIIEPTGVILTANHVTLSDPNDPLSQPFNDFVIEMTSDWRQTPQTRYHASLAASDRTNDLALLQIYWDEVKQRTIEVTELALPTLLLAPMEAVNLGERLHFLGYPLLGGATINYLDLGLSGYDGQDSGLLKVTGALSSGYSGGPALMEGDDGFRIIGIVIRQRFAQRAEQALGQVSLIRSVDELSGFDWTPTARRLWVQEAVVSEVEMGEKALTIDLSLRAIDFAARNARVMAYAYDAANGEPWRPQQNSLPTTFTGQVVLSANFDISAFLGTRRITLHAPTTAFMDSPEELAFRIVVWDTNDARALWRDTEWRRPAVVNVATTTAPVRLVTALPAEPEAPSTPILALPTPSPIPSFTPTSSPTPTATSTPHEELATCRVLISALRLRTGPGSEYASQAMLDAGATLTLLDHETSTSWVEVRTSTGLRGWVYASPSYVDCGYLTVGRPIDTASIPLSTLSPISPAVAGGPTAIEPLTPADGTNSRDPLLFSWAPNGPLAEDQVYELVFWAPNKGQDHVLDGESWRSASRATSVTIEPAQRASESYRWGVWLGSFDADGEYSRIRYLGGGWSLTVP